MLTIGKAAARDAEAVRSLAFIRRAQECGFSLAEIRELLRLRGASGAHCGDVRQRAEEKKRELAARIRAMRAVCRTLDGLIAECGARARTADDCPILTGLEQGSTRSHRPPASAGT